MSQTVSYLVAPSLYLVNQRFDAAKTETKPVEVPTNHLVVLDCSGSMYGELPKIREQLKRKLPKLIGENDTLSMIWFSGRGQCGVLIDGEPVSTLTDLNTINKAIDRWLQPQGLTGFKDPLIETQKLIKSLGAKRPGSAFSLFFLSDGCDNCCSRSDILKTAEETAQGLAAATFVEYGYYADRPLLTAMAERSGGQLIFAEAFDKYVPMFESAMQKRPMGGKRVEVSVQGDPIGGFVWTQNEGDLITFGLTGGKASVPESTKDVWYLSPNIVGTVEGKGAVSVEATTASYAAISLFSIRMKPDVVLPFLKLTGDVAFVTRFGGLYGKQKYTEFMEEAKAAVFDESKRLTKGYNSNALPRDDAFTVLDVLNLLATDEDNRVLLDHEAFKYSRIGRARVDAVSLLTAGELAELAKLTEEMRTTKDLKKAQGISAKITAITSKPDPLKFVADPAPEGYPVSSLTYNEENPNVSFLVRKTGKVDISNHAPDAVKAKIPSDFPTFVFRNYAVVKDGLVNIEVLPAKLSQKTIETLFAAHKDGRLPDDALKTSSDHVLINFKALPVINRQQVKTVSAKTLFENEWALIKTQAAQKVYKSVLKEKFGTKKSEGFEEKYGTEVANWLKEVGFTDYSGFGPKSVQKEATDFYMAKEMSVSIKSFSSIPSLNEFKKQAAKGKLTPSAQLMADSVQHIETFLASMDAKDDKKAETWLKAQDKALDRVRRTLISDKAKQIFGIIVGQTWPFASPDENSMELTLDGQKLACKIEQREVEIKV
jgi:hypothetical protein